MGQNKPEHLMFQDNQIFGNKSGTYQSTAPLYQQGCGFTCKYQFYKITSFFSQVQLQAPILYQPLASLDRNHAR
jgi:hypothetical protein